MKKNTCEKCEKPAICTYKSNSYCEDCATTKALEDSEKERKERAALTFGSQADGCFVFQDYLRIKDTKKNRERLFSLMMFSPHVAFALEGVSLLIPPKTKVKRNLNRRIEFIVVVGLDELGNKLLPGAYLELYENFKFYDFDLPF